MKKNIFFSTFQKGFLCLPFCLSVPLSLCLSVFLSFCHFHSLFSISAFFCFLSPFFLSVFFISLCLSPSFSICLVFISQPLSFPLSLSHNHSLSPPPSHSINLFLLSNFLDFYLKYFWSTTTVGILALNRATLDNEYCIYIFTLSPTSLFWESFCRMSWRHFRRRV